MRGEESGDRAGQHPRRRHAPAVHAGTHSKWVRLEAGRIVSIATAMTGELFELLRKHGSLAPLMPGDASTHNRKLAQGFADSETHGGLLHHIFAVRTQSLFDALPRRIGSRISRACWSGTKCAHCCPCPGWQRTRRSTSSGNRACSTPTRQAFALLGVDNRQYPEGIAAAGLHAIARQRGIA